MPRLAQNPHTPLERLRQSRRDKTERWRSLLAQPEIPPEPAWPFATGGSSLFVTGGSSVQVNPWWITTTTANTNFYPTTITTTTATNVWLDNVAPYVAPYQWAQSSVQWFEYGPPVLPGPHVDYETRRRRDATLREKARKRGRRLLMGILNDQQLIEYAKTRGFTVVGDKGGIFRIQKVGRVQELDLHRHIIALHCIHLSFAYIEEDNLVALKMLIETDEMEFRRIANTQHTHPLPLQEAA